MKTNFPTVGFDRFIELEWADYAIELGITGGNPAQLKVWLEERIAGKESVRKTGNLLTNLWLKSYPETVLLREEGLHLASAIPHNQYLIIHWGMALANFPLFQHTAANIGRLLRLQGSFRVTELVRRVSESYSNQGTIPRIMGRILQTLVHWNVLSTKGDGFYIATSIRPIENQTLLAWLFQAALIRDQERHIGVVDLLRLPELFPFEVTNQGRVAILASPKFTVLREGMNQEYVSLARS